MDFGLARMRLMDDEGDPRPRQVQGSPGYMSPEQVQGEGEIGAASDLFVLGAILFELLTGRPLFGGATIMARMYQVMHADLSATLETLDHLVPGAGHLVKEAVAHEPRARWESARAFGEAVGAMRATLGESSDLCKFANAWLGEDHETLPSLPAIPLEGVLDAPATTLRTQGTLPAYTLEELPGLEEVGEGDRHRVHAWLDEGAHFLCTSQPLRSLERFDRVLAVDDSNEQAWVGKALSYYDLGNVALALSWARKGLATLPRSACLLGIVGATLARVNAQTGALEHAQRALRIEPADPFGWWAMALVENQRAGKRVSYFTKKALGCCKDETHWLLRLAVCGTLAGDADLSRTLLEKVVQREPQNLMAWKRLAVCYRDLGWTEDMRAAFEKVLELDADDSTATEALGRRPSAQSMTERIGNILNRTRSR
jgi:tetratricopeptide (TPR) repeat protein